MRKLAAFLVAAFLLFSAAPVSAAVRAVSNAPQPAGKSSVTVLMYHKISDDPADANNAFCISSKTFEEDIRFLKENGYTFCFASEVDDVLSGKRPRRNYVAVTFDDGYESDFYFAKPVLERYGAKATFFVIGSKIGMEDHIAKEHLSALSRLDVVEIGSHSYGLHNMPVAELKQSFDSKNPKPIADDFLKSANILEKIIGKKVAVLSYPNGIYNTETDRALRNAGFTATFTSDEKRPVYPGVPHGRINRWKGAALKNLLAK